MKPKRTREAALDAVLGARLLLETEATAEETTPAGLHLSSIEEVHRLSRDAGGRSLSSAPPRAVKEAITQVFSVPARGALGDVRSVTDGAMTAGSAVLTSATAAFTERDLNKLVSVSGAGPVIGNTIAGKGNMTSGSTTLTLTDATLGRFRSANIGDPITVAGAGVAGATLDTTIATYVSRTEVTLATPASTTVSGATVTFGSNFLAATIAAYNSPTSVTLSAPATRTVAGKAVEWGTDDTAKLQAAIDAAPAGAIVDFGGVGRTYFITTALTPKSGQTWRGSATVKLAPAADVNVVLMVGLNNVTLEGPVIDGNKDYQTPGVNVDGINIRPELEQGTDAAISSGSAVLSTAPRTFTVTASNDTFTCPANHLLSNNFAVILSGLTGAAGITAGTQYYVRDATPTTFKLSATLDGPVINITSDGSGTARRVAFTATHQGKAIGVDGAGASAARLVTTILTVDSPTQVTLATTAGTTVGTAGFTIGLANSTNITLRNLTIKNTRQRGVHAGPQNGREAALVNGLRVITCWIEGTRAHGIQLAYDCPNAFILGNDILNIGLGTGLSNTNGIWVGRRSHRARIHFNHVRDGQDMGIEVYGTVEDASLIGNQVHRVDRMGISLSGSINPNLVGNFIKNTGWAGLELALVNGGSISNTTIIAPGRPAVTFNRTNGVSYTGGTIRDAGSVVFRFYAVAGRTVGDGAMTAGSDVLTATASFTETDEGSVVTVAGAGDGGATLSSRIRRYVSATEVELGDTASTTVTGATTVITPEERIIRDNTISDVVVDGTTGTNAVFQWQTNQAIRNLKITDCHFAHIARLFHRQSGSIEGLKFTDNDVREWSETTALTLSSVTGADISHNRFEHQTAAGKECLRVSGSRYTISENEFVPSTGSSLSGTAITLDGVTRASVNKNIITAVTGSTTKGIDVTGTCSKIGLRGNDIEGYSGVGGVAIAIGASVTNWLARGNVTDGNTTRLSDSSAVGQGRLHGNPGIDGAIGAAVYRTTNQSVNSGTATAVTYDAERYDTDGIHSTSSNTNRLTAQRPGKYLIEAGIEFDANATGIRLLSLRLNNATTIRSVRVNAAATGTTRVVASRVYNLAAGDFIDTVVFQDSGGALNILAAGNYTPELTITLLE